MAGLRNPLDRMSIECGRGDSLVDEMIGTAYDNVRLVAVNIEYVKLVAVQMQSVFLLAGELDKVEALASRLDSLDAIIASLPLLESVATLVPRAEAAAAALEAVRPLVDNIQGLTALAGSLPDLLVLKQNLAKLEALSASLARLLDLQSKAQDLLIGFDSVPGLKDRMAQAEAGIVSLKARADATEAKDLAQDRTITELASRLTTQEGKPSSFKFNAKTSDASGQVYAYGTDIPRTSTNAQTLEQALASLFASVGTKAEQAALQAAVSLISTKLDANQVGLSVASLVGGKLDPNQIPALAIAELFKLAPGDSLTGAKTQGAQDGDVALVIDGNGKLTGRYMLFGDRTVTTNWIPFSDDARILLATDISDSTALGRALMTATDADAAKGFLEIGDSLPDQTGQDGKALFTYAGQAGWASVFPDAGTVQDSLDWTLDMGFPPGKTWGAASVRLVLGGRTYTVSWFDNATNDDVCQEVNACDPSKLFAQTDAQGRIRLVATTSYSIHPSLGDEGPLPFGQYGYPQGAYRDPALKVSVSQRAAPPVLLQYMLDSMRSEIDNLAIRADHPANPSAGNMPASARSAKSYEGFSAPSPGSELVVKAGQNSAVHTVIGNLTDILDVVSTVTAAGQGQGFGAYSDGDRLVVTALSEADGLDLSATDPAVLAWLGFDQPIIPAGDQQYLYKAEQIRDVSSGVPQLVSTSLSWIRRKLQFLKASEIIAGAGGFGIPIMLDRKLQDLDQADAANAQAIQYEGTRIDGVVQDLADVGTLLDSFDFRLANQNDQITILLARKAADIQTADGTSIQSKLNGFDTRITNAQAKADTAETDAQTGITNAKTAKDRADAAYTLASTANTTAGTALQFVPVASFVKGRRVLDPAALASTLPMAQAIQLNLTAGGANAKSVLIDPAKQLSDIVTQINALGAPYAAKFDAQGYLCIWTTNQSDLGYSVQGGADYAVGPLFGFLKDISNPIIMLPASTEAALRANYALAQALQSYTPKRIVVLVQGIISFTSQHVFQDIDYSRVIIKGVNDLFVSSNVTACTAAAALGSNNNAGVPLYAITLTSSAAHGLSVGNKVALVVRSTAGQPTGVWQPLGGSFDVSAVNSATSFQVRVPSNVSLTGLTSQGFNGGANSVTLSVVKLLDGIIGFSGFSAIDVNNVTLGGVGGLYLQGGSQATAASGIRVRGVNGSVLSTGGIGSANCTNGFHIASNARCRIGGNTDIFGTDPFVAVCGCSNHGLFANTGTKFDLSDATSVSSNGNMADGFYGLAAEVDILNTMVSAGSTYIPVTFGGNNGQAFSASRASRFFCRPNGMYRSIYNNSAYGNNFQIKIEVQSFVDSFGLSTDITANITSNQLSADGSWLTR